MSDLSLQAQALRSISVDFESVMTGFEAQNATSNKEKQSKVGTEQHQRIMGFLTEKLSESLAEKHGQKDPSLDPRLQAAANASTSDVAFEASKRDAQLKNAESAATTLSAGESSASEELKKATSKQAQERANAKQGKPVGGAQGSMDGEDGLGSLPNWGPPNPPAPEFPPGFSMDSIANQTVNNHEALLTSLMIKVANLMSDEALNRVESNSEYQKQSNKLTQEEIKLR